MEDYYKRFMYNLYYPNNIPATNNDITYNDNYGYY